MINFCALGTPITVRRALKNVFANPPCLWGFLSDGDLGVLGL